MIQGTIAASRALLTDLECRLAKEQSDVTKPEQGAFMAFLAGLTGDKEEKLARDRAEAVRQRVEGRPRRSAGLLAEQGYSTTW